MDTIVKALNEKAVELGGEGNAETVVEALNDIALATGGTPTDKNSIVEALDGVEFGGGGGGGGEPLPLSITNHTGRQMYVDSFEIQDGQFTVFHTINANETKNYNLYPTTDNQYFCVYMNGNTNGGTGVKIVSDGTTENYFYDNSFEFSAMILCSTNCSSIEVTLP